MDGSDEALTGCLCMGGTDEFHRDEGSPLDLEVRSSDWGPGCRAERLGVVRQWRAAMKGGCCALPDGWGTDRLPAHMEQEVRSWEEEAGHGRYVDRWRGVLTSTGAHQHTNGHQMGDGTGGSASVDQGNTHRTGVLRGTSGGAP